MAKAIWDKMEASRCSVMLDTKDKETINKTISSTWDEHELASHDYLNMQLKCYPLHSFMTSNTITRLKSTTTTHEVSVAYSSIRIISQFQTQWSYITILLFNIWIKLCMAILSKTNANEAAININSPMLNIIHRSPSIMQLTPYTSNVCSTPVPERE